MVVSWNLGKRGLFVPVSLFVQFGVRALVLYSFCLICTAKEIFKVIGLISDLKFNYFCWSVHYYMWEYGIHLDRRKCLNHVFSN